MKRLFYAPWWVALAVLALAVLPVLAALSSHREQARRAESLLFERSADLVTNQLRLLTSRHANWQNGIRMRLSNRPDPPEMLLDEVFSPSSSMVLPEHCRMLAYAALEDGQVLLRWQKLRDGTAIAATGDDLLALPETAALLRDAMEKPAQVASHQHGVKLLTAMTVAESSPHQPRGWLIAWWDLAAMSADPQLQLVVKDETLTARAFDGTQLPMERVVVIGEGGTLWRVVIGKGPTLRCAFP